MADGFPQATRPCSGGQIGVNCASTGGANDRSRQTLPPRQGGRLDPLQILFWGAVAVGVDRGGRCHHRGT